MPKIKNFWHRALGDRVPQPLGENTKYHMRKIKKFDLFGKKERANKAIMRQEDRRSSYRRHMARLQRVVHQKRSFLGQWFDEARGIDLKERLLEAKYDLIEIYKEIRYDLTMDENSHEKRDGLIDRSRQSVEEIWRQTKFSATFDEAMNESSPVAFSDRPLLEKALEGFARGLDHDLEKEKDRLRDHNLSGISGRVDRTLRQKAIDEMVAAGKIIYKKRSGIDFVAAAAGLGPYSSERANQEMYKEAFRQICKKEFFSLFLDENAEEADAAIEGLISQCEMDIIFQSKTEDKPSKNTRKPVKLMNKKLKEMKATKKITSKIINGLTSKPEQKF